MDIDLRLIADAARPALLASCNGGLWTLRVTVAAAGRKLMAATIAGLESLLFAVAFGAVLSSLDDPVRIVGYAVGVASGTLLGLVADERLSTGRRTHASVAGTPPPAHATSVQRRGRFGAACVTVAGCQRDDSAMTDLRPTLPVQPPWR